MDQPQRPLADQLHYCFFNDRFCMGWSAGKDPGNGSCFEWSGVACYTRRNAAGRKKYKAGWYLPPPNDPAGGRVDRGGGDELDELSDDRPLAGMVMVGTVL